MQIWLRRAYEPAGPQDGCRILVDRLWPRGVRREDARIDLWLKEVAPSPQLRRWFGHDPAKWSDFKKRYAAELDRNPEPVQELIARGAVGRLTLVFAARDEKHNNAAALKGYLERTAG